jgi:hypothetical protein
MKRLWIVPLALALAGPPVSLGASAAPKNDNAIVKSEKKPGKNCNSLGPGSSAFKDCVQAQAHIGQSDNGKGKGKGQSKKP